MGAEAAGARRGWPAWLPTCRFAATSTATATATLGRLCPLFQKIAGASRSSGWGRRVWDMKTAKPRTSWLREAFHEGAEIVAGGARDQRSGEATAAGAPGRHGGACPHRRRRAKARALSPGVAASAECAHPDWEGSGGGKAVTVASEGQGVFHTVPVHRQRQEIASGCHALCAARQERPMPPAARLRRHVDRVACLGKAMPREKSSSGIDLAERRRRPSGRRRCGGGTGQTRPDPRREGRSARRSGRRERWEETGRGRGCRSSIPMERLLTSLVPSQPETPAHARRDGALTRPSP